MPATRHEAGAGPVARPAPLSPDRTVQNKRRSLAVMAVFALVVAAIVAACLAIAGLGAAGLVIALVVGGVATLAARRCSDAVVLRASRAVAVDAATHARLHNLVEGLCIAGGLPKPRIYVIDDVAPNAFAAGRDAKHAAVAVTTGLLDTLNRVELEAVLAHELSRIKDDEILLSTIAVTTAGLVTLAADASLRLKWWNGGRRGRDDRAGGAAPWLGFIGIGLLYLAPLLGRLLHLAVGSRRESLATDVLAIELTRYPPGLISALEKLGEDSTVVAASSRATAHLWIASPVALTDAEGQLAARNRCFDTHPSIEDRIAALREL